MATTKTVTKKAGKRLPLTVQTRNARNSAVAEVTKTKAPTEPAVTGTTIKEVSVIVMKGMGKADTHIRRT